MSKPEQAAFELVAGNVSLDFINTLDDRPSGQPKELLNDYDDLAGFAHQSGILSSKQFDHLCRRVDRKPVEASEALHRAHTLREALHDIFSAVTNKKTVPHPALEVLNANLHDAALHSNLMQREGRLEWRFDDMTSSCNAMLWPIARAAADLLASSDVAYVHNCSSPTCRWFFLDTSKNHRRRWCDMKLCGNRDKVRRFYARQRTS